MAESMSNGFGETMPHHVTETVPKIPGDCWSIDAMMAGKKCTIQPNGTFVYLDVGRWGDEAPNQPEPPSQRSFGVVWGKHAVLCSYYGTGGRHTGQGCYVNAPHVKLTHTNGNSPLDKVLKAFGSRLIVIKDEWSPAAIPDERIDSGTIYVILGDLHIPIKRSVPAFNQNPPYEIKWGRKPFDENYMVRIAEWYNHYEKSDIFGNADVDLIDFFSILESAQNVLTRDHDPQKIHFVQVGDFCDLWNGLERFFCQNSWGIAVVDLINTDGVLVDDFVWHWLNECINNFPQLFNKIASLTIDSTYLYGNHDCYLNPIIFRAANVVGGIDRGKPVLSPPLQLPSGIKTRERFISKGGVKIQHGHAADNSNCDGTVTGHDANHFNFICDNALRPFEDLAINVVTFGQVRRRFTNAAACEFALSNIPAFAVYVMGHTHSPFLTRVVVV